MIRHKRRDTLIGNVEASYGIDLHSRSDARLGNVLRRRGFSSVTKLVAAYRGQAIVVETTRHVFFSFHAEDLPQVQGLRLMALNEHVSVDFYDSSLTKSVRSEASSYIKATIREKLSRASVLICLIGNGTAWRDWVDWEIRTAYSMGKGVCGVRLKGSVGRVPPALKDLGVPVFGWGVQNITAAIECAAARRG